MAPKVKHPDRVRKLLKRSARFRRRVQKALERHESVDVIKFNQLVDALIRSSSDLAEHEPARSAENPSLGQT